MGLHYLLVRLYKFGGLYYNLLFRETAMYGRPNFLSTSNGADDDGTPQLQCQVQMRINMSYSLNSLKFVYKC